MMSKVDSTKYVVLDVETNGLSSLNDDLLSISIYRPDDGKEYNRFLPLELNRRVYTTYINGITDEKLKNKLPLTQEEFDNIIQEFDLDNRTILHYGGIDQKFIKNYLKRKKITGYEKLKFYNFKHDIISNKFSEGNITKDNLCRIYGIENIKEIHSGLNDCILEWQLFNKMAGNRLIVIGNNVYEFNHEYIIPVSYLQNYTNFKYHIDNFPKISYDLDEIKTIRISSSKIKKFETNISGIAIEHLINSLLNVEDRNEETFLFQVANKSKLKKIGELPSMLHVIPVIMNKDGTITAVSEEDKKKVSEVNEVTEIIKAEIKPLINFIKNKVFDNKPIISQELVINKEDNVLAKCDLSTEDKIMEIKAFNIDVERIKYQLYYEAHGREIYILQTFWDTNLKQGLKFVIHKVTPREFVPKVIDRTKQIQKRKREIEKKIDNPNIKIINYINTTCDIRVKCNICDAEWDISYNRLKKNSKCPVCNPKPEKVKKVPKKIDFEKRFRDKISLKSNERLFVITYGGAKEKSRIKCMDCGNEWEIRSDHLVERCYCPKCRNR